MTLKQSSNGNCFETWLCEYKTRLEQVYLRGRVNNDDQHTNLASDTERPPQADDQLEAAPALAGKTYVLFQQPLSA